MSVDRFVVEATLGEGGMATVYQVRHRDLGTVHALKVLHFTHPTVRDRLIDEGRVQARLKHPNVLAVSDVLDVDGSPGLLMEYVRGPSLEAALTAGRLPLEVADLIVPGILAGVAAAHRAQVVHRDLKPANILLQVRDGRVIPKVADFGLVKLLGDHAAGRTRSGHTMGTPSYMAPEQIRSSRDVDARADIFALGAILYELATGVRAFEPEADNPLSALALVTEGRYTPVRQHNPDAPERVVLAITSALALDPAARPPTCEALWSLWAPPGPPPLADAAAVPRRWPDAWFERLGALVPAASDDHAPSSGNATWRPSAEPSSFDPPPPRRLYALALGGVAVLGLLGCLGGLGLAATLYRRQPPAPAPAVIEPPAPAPIPAPAPPAPPPVAPPVAPAPAGPRPAAPVAPITARVTVRGDAPVRLVGPGGRDTPLDAVPLGRYRVEGQFGGQWTPTGEIAIEAGSAPVITCSAEIRNCTW